MHPNAAAVWVKFIQSLPPAQMKFALNAASDTVPHNVNLSLWRRNDHLSAACRLCGVRQTLCHVLSNCKVALELCRYNIKHDNILHIITEFLKEQVSDDMTILADLTDQYMFPPSLAPSDLWPDLVAYSELTKTAIIIELTVCFETNFRKLRKERSLNTGMSLQKLKEMIS